MNPLHTPSASAMPERLVRLVDYLAADPANPNLLEDVATVAFDAQHFALCDEMLARRETLGPLSPALLNLRGLSAMAQRRFDDALALFESLRAAGSDPVVEYNMAYAKAMLGRFEEAIALLADPVLAAVSPAVALKLQSLHHLGRLADAIELGKQHANDPGIGAEISGLLATALFDAEDVEGARHYAAQASGTADGITVRGLLALDGADTHEALDLFGHALSLSPGNSRARLGLGLSLLAQEQFADAAEQIDLAAAAFETHAGSWVAAGWAHLLGGKLKEARTRFEQAARADRGFAEAPGGLAVVDVYEGKLDEAKRHAAIALRLDRNCLSAAQALTLLSTAAGDHAAAGAIRDTALHRTLGPNGRTIAAALSRRAARMSRKP